jgi:hypothetical protein
MPKLRIDVAGRYWKVSFEEESSIEIPDPDEKITPIKSKQKIIKTKAKVTKESVKKNDKKTLPKKGIEEEEGNIYLEELKEIWKEAKAYPKFTEIMQVLRGLKKVNPKEIRKICIRIYEDENAISDELEFNESVKETVDVVAGRLTDEEFEKRN